MKAKITDFKPYGGAWGDDFDDLIEAGEKKAKEAADKAAGKRSGGGSGSSGGTRPARQADDTGMPFDGGGADDSEIPF